MELWYPKAQRKPLGPQTEHVIRPRIFIVHTMVGSLRGTHGMFSRNGYTGTESTFGIGGPGDLDGVVYQWQRLDYSADAQGAGNAYSTSVETADRANPNNPWSDAQLEALIDLGTWWAKNVGAPARIVDSTIDRGFGWHRQFKVWNPNNHSCPGDVRLKQYRRDVIPAIAARLEAPVKLTAANVRDPATGKPILRRMLSEGDDGPDVRLLQHLVNVRVDGDFGAKTHVAVLAWQRKNALEPDGVFGPASARAAGWIWKG